jgi:hypothetical protein
LGKSGRRWDGGEGILLPAKLGMQRRNLTLLLVATACVATVGWLAWPPVADPLPEPPSGPERIAAPEPRPLPARPAPGQDPDPAPLPTDAPRVVVAVRELWPYVAPRPPRVLATMAGSSEELPVQLLAGTDASPFGDGARAGLVLASIDLGGGAFALRQVAVETAAPTRLVLGPRRLVRGTVVDARQQPIAGAQVALGEYDTSGAVRAVTTDAEGHFELDTWAGDGVPLVVEADGHASQWRSLQVLENGENLRVVPLPEGGELAVQLAGEARAVEAARVFVVPLASLATEWVQFPFFLQLLGRGTAVQANGRATLRGLPRTGSIGVVVQHPGLPLAAPVEARPGALRAPLLVPLSLQPLATGRLVDADGAPVAGALALLRPGGRAMPASGSLRMLPPGLDAQGCTLAYGAADGTLAMAGSAAAGSVLSLRAPGYAGRDLPFTAAWLTEPIVLPVWRGGEPSLRLLPPRAGGRWQSEWNLSGGLQLTHEAGASPTVALPQAGRFEVQVTTFVGSERKATVTLPAIDATGPIDVQAPPPDGPR